VGDVRSLARTRGWRYVPGVPESTQRRGPSHTLPEEAADLLHGFHSRVRSEFGVERTRTIESVERDYARLYAVSEYRCAETFACEIPDAIVAGEYGVVLTSRLEILYESLASGDPVRAKLETIRGTAAGIRPDTLPGTYVSLLGFAHLSYAHWLLDLLPRLSLVPADEEGFRVLVPGDVRPFHLRTLELLGIGADRIVPARAPNVRVDRLLLCSPTPRTTRPVAAHLRWVRERLLAAAGTEPGPPRRLYVSRAHAERRVVNEDELLPVLARHGVERVFAEELDAAEQIRLFAGAELVAGPHGAGIHNHLFAPDRARVVELYNPRYLGLSALGSAALVGQEHWHLFGAPQGQGLDVHVDPERLDRLLRRALESVE
jgi:capsular polysaccharide biosynthesis protein